MSYKKITLLTRRHSEQGTINHHQIISRKVWTIYYQYIQNVDQKMNFYDSDEIEIKPPFYRSFSTFWNIIGGFCTQVFYS